MDETYDAILLGTSITTCILSGILSVEGKKVLHMDKERYYGGDGASLNLTQLYEKFRPGVTPAEKLGKDRDYSIDLIPKFMMADGKLVQILIHTDVTRYCEFKQAAASYVLRDNKVHKVPSTPTEALSSGLMGIFEKRRMKNYLVFTNGYEQDKPDTQQGVNLDTATQLSVFQKFGLDAGTQEFVGHSLALWTNDNYLQKPARETHDKVMLYNRSIAKYGQSPYIYPMYGLGELPQAFARLSAIYGGTYMLDKPVSSLSYDENGKVNGVVSGGETAKTPLVIGDPSYFPDKTKKEGSVVRAICLLRHPIPGTDNADSCQIIIPQSQAGRKNDIYIAMVSHTHNVCAKDYYVAFVSTKVETSTPELELEFGLRLLGPIEEKFIAISDLLAPAADGRSDQVFVTRSLDASSHFESVAEDVEDVYFRITGKPLVLKKRAENAEES